MFESAIPENEEARLVALSRYEILDSDREEAYDDITRLACFICETPFALVTLVDRDRQWFKSEIGMGIRETERPPSFCATAMLQPEPTVIPDTHADPRYVNNPFVTGTPGIRFYAGTPLVTNDGHALGTLCVFDTRPRTIRREQTAALQALGRQVMALLELRLRMRENERQANALRTTEKLVVVGRLASSMAHEINNPLQSVTNLLFMTGVGLAGPSKNYLTQAQDELRRVTHIVTQTLRFHHQSEKATATRVGEIVESVAALFATRLRHASARVQIEDHQIRLLQCHAADLRQVFANLMSNALDAVVAAHGDTIRFSIRDVVDAVTGVEGLCVTVADNGAGMSAETRSRLFEPFYSTKGERGTGLGLWVSRGILEKHRAKMRVKSSPGPVWRGTVFRVFFPWENGL